MVPMPRLRRELVWKAGELHRSCTPCERHGMSLVTKQYRLFRIELVQRAVYR
jgi:hypothetical protein